MRGVIFCALATIGVRREQITIRTINERWEKYVWYEEKTYGHEEKANDNGEEKTYGKKKANDDEEERIIMSEVKKDVTVHVTGVAMSGGVKNDSNGSPSANKKEPEGKTARDS